MDAALAALFPATELLLTATIFGRKMPQPITT